jgi:hypothetical protein
MVSEDMTLSELIGACDADALDALDHPALARFAAELLAWWPRLDAARLRVLAAVEARQAFRVDGARDAASWVAAASGERRGAARRDVELASTLTAMPAVARRLADGSLSTAKVRELARAASADDTEQERLATAAVALSAEQVAHEVDRWQLEHDTAPAPVKETLRITPRAGGGRVEAELDAEGLEWVQVAVDAAAERLGLRDLPWDQRRARGLVGACRYFLEHVDVPATRVGRPTVVVTVDLETLGAATGGAARLDSGAYVSGEVARRLACDAGVVRMLTDAESMPLDLGRKTRVPSPAQCRAVIHRDRHCRYEGCEAPPWACEVHHLVFWGPDGGRTDLAGLALICWHHHGLTHRQSTTHDLVDRGDGRLHLRRRRTECSDAA